MGTVAKLKALDLFCGAGGAAMGLHRAGFEVIGVDVAPQPRYPFRFVQMDWRDTFNYWQAGTFDFVWASPPCQRYCALKVMRNAREHPDFVDEVRERLRGFGLPYVIENVFGAPLNNPIVLCGSHFALQSNGFQLRRHRYFEASFSISSPGQCAHAPRTLGVYGQKVRDIAQEKRHYAKPEETRGQPVGVVLPQRWGKEAMGIDWMNMQELSEAIPPAYSEYIGRQFLKGMERAT